MSINTPAIVHRVFSYNLNATDSFALKGKILRGLEKRFIRFANKAEACFSNKMTGYIKRKAHSLEIQNIAVNKKIIGARYGEGAFAHLQSLHTTDFKRLDQLQNKLKNTQTLTQGLLQLRSDMIANAEALQADHEAVINQPHQQDLVSLNKHIQLQEDKEKKLLLQIKNEQLTIQNFKRSSAKYRLNEPMSNIKWAQVALDMSEFHARANKIHATVLDEGNAHASLTTTDTLIENQDRSVLMLDTHTTSTAVQTDPIAPPRHNRSWLDTDLSPIEEHLNQLSELIQADIDRDNATPSGIQLSPISQLDSDDFEAELEGEHRVQDLGYASGSITPSSSTESLNQSKKTVTWSEPLTSNN